MSLVANLRAIVRTGALLIATVACAPIAHANSGDAPGDPDDTALPARGERFAIFGQATYVTQATDSFAAPYSGPNSLTPGINRETADFTLYLGLRTWNHGELWLNPELDQGFGLDNTLGVAGFPSGEAYKVGKQKPYFRLPRAFIRQTIDIGEAAESVDGTANQLAGMRSADRWVVTVGKFGVTDVFDVNQYAHDPRVDFLNWAAIDAGTFDYAADAWGFTFGASAERYHDAWTFRTGFFDLSDVPNSAHLEPGFHEFQLVGEIERRYALRSQPGKILATYYQSHGRMGLLDDAVRLAEATGGAADAAAVRSFRTRSGLSVSLEQQIAHDVGLFARAGNAGGNVEAYEFTDIDRTAEIGVAIRGSRWRRVNDSFGVVMLENGISSARERYLDAGGLGILIGDGRLPHPGLERILEIYYSVGFLARSVVTADIQRIANPAYNRDRGPVSVIALRFHTQF
jgi:high affinity Mn2+ porin